MVTVRLRLSCRRAGIEVSGPTSSIYTAAPFTPVEMPPAEVYSVGVDPSKYPRGVRTVVNFVQKHGGSSVVTYGRAHIPARGNTSVLKHSLLIRISTRAGGPVTWGAYYWAPVSTEDHTDPFVASYSTGGCVSSTRLGVYTVTEMKKLIAEEASNG